MRGEAGWLTVGLGPDGVEVDEPGFEEGLGHGFEGLAHASVEFDFVVEGAEDAGDASLFVEWGEVHDRRVEMVSIQTRHRSFIRVREKIETL